MTDTIPALLLAVEASTRALSVALFENGRFGDEIFLFDPGRGHAETLLPTLDGLLSRNGKKPGGLSALAVTRGPGSFTSVRIGLATTLGLAYPRRLPVHALSTLEILACEIEDRDAWVLPMLDARKGEVYAALYRPGQPLGEAAFGPLALSAKDVAESVLELADGPIVALGDGSLAYAEQLRGVSERLIIPTELQHPHARRLGERVLARLAQGVPTENAAPLYLRKPEAVVNLEKKKPG